MWLPHSSHDALRHATHSSSTQVGRPIRPPSKYIGLYVHACNVSFFNIRSDIFFISEGKMSTRFTPNCTIPRKFLEEYAPEPPSYRVTSLHGMQIAQSQQKLTPPPSTGPPPGKSCTV